MPSLRDKYLARLPLTLEQASVMRLLGEYRGRQELYARQRPETLEALRTVAKVESTDASNRLEGITAPRKRLTSLVLHRTTPRNRSEREIAGYRDALELIHQARTDMPVTVNVILQLHKTITKYTTEEGGKWKPVDNQIVERDDQGKVVRVRFQAVPAVATPQAMDDLVSLYGDAVSERREPLLVIPLTVLDFLCIHPFRDGNGRVSRLLTLLLLYHAGYDVGRYISLERIFEETSRTYYDALEASSAGWHETGHDVMSWTEYFWGVLLRAYREFAERVGSLDGGRGSKSDRVRDAVGRQIRPFGIAEIERECPGVSRETIRLVMREMKGNGFLSLTGRGRGARWRRTDKKQ